MIYWIRLRNKTTVSCTGDCVTCIHASARVTEFGRKHNSRMADYLIKHSCAALRPMFVRVSSSAPARAGLSWQRRALMKNTKPAEKPIPAFLRGSRKAQDADHTPGVLIDQLSQAVTLGGVLALSDFKIHQTPRFANAKSIRRRAWRTIRQHLAHLADT
jgi:hypothetical protein